MENNYSEEITKIISGQEEKILRLTCLRGKFGIGFSVFDRKESKTLITVKNRKDAEGLITTIKETNHLGCLLGYDTQLPSRVIVINGKHCNGIYESRTPEDFITSIMEIYSDFGDELKLHRPMDYGDIIKKMGFNSIDDINALPDGSLKEYALDRIKLFEKDKNELNRYKFRYQSQEEAFLSGDPTEIAFFFYEDMLDWDDRIKIYTAGEGG